VVFQKRVLRTLFLPKRDEIREGWNKLHNEEVYNFYSSPDIIRIIRSIKIKWAGHMAGMGEKTIACTISVGKLKERDHWEI
jgi:hypothetical protein